MTLSDDIKAKIQAEYDSWKDKLWAGKTKEERQKLTTLVKGALHDYIWKEFTHLPQRLKFKFWQNVYGWHF